LIDFDEIWQGDANSPLTADRLLKCRIFENPKWRQPPSSNISKVAISPQRFDRHIEKNVKSPYICDCLTDFDEIWRDYAYWPLAADQPLKF